jgi:hypothetical protein
VRDSNEPELPFSYASATLPVFDRNLKNLAEKIRPSCVLARVRGVAYSSAAGGHSAEILVAAMESTLAILREARALRDRKLLLGQPLPHYVVQRTYHPGKQADTANIGK